MTLTEGPDGRPVAFHDVLEEHYPVKITAFAPGGDEVWRRELHGPGALEVPGTGPGSVERVLVEYGNGEWAEERSGISWECSKVAKGGRHPEFGTQVVFAWEVKRECGCGANIGMRLDNRETVFGAFTCDDHEDAVVRALNIAKTMPPQNTEMMRLWMDLLEGEIAR